MFNNETLARSATERAEQITAAGVSYGIKPNTPLQMLLAHSFSQIPTDSYDLFQFGNNEEFKSVLEGQAEFLADAAARHRNFACNVARPVIMEAVETLTKGIGEMKVDFTQGMTIQPTGAIEFFDAVDFTEYVNRFYQGLSATEKTLKYPLYTKEQIIGVISTNNAIDQNAFTELLGEMPDTALEVVWQSIFMDKTNYSPTVEVKPMHSLMIDFRLGGHGALLAFIIGTSLALNIGDDAGMGLSDARTALLQITGVAAHYVRSARDYKITMREAGYIVKDYDAVTKRVSVDKVTYDKWLAEGGRVEALLMAAMNGDTNITLNSLRVNAERLAKEWDFFVLSQSTVQETQLTNGITSLMRAIFNDYMEVGNMTEDEASVFSASGMREKAIAMFASAIDSVPTTKIRETPQEVFWHAFAKARYFYSNAYELLADIDHLVNKEGLEVEEAAQRAIMQQIFVFVASMMDSRKAIL